MSEQGFPEERIDAIQTHRRYHSQHTLSLSSSFDASNKIGKQGSDGISIPGVQRIMRATNSAWRRIVWSLLVGACSVFCCWMLQDRLVRYFDAPTTLDSRPTYNKSVVFPSITLCPVQEPFDDNSGFYQWLSATYRYKESGYKTIEDIPFAELNFTIEDIWNNSTVGNEQIYVQSSCGLINGEYSCDYQSGVTPTLNNFTYYTIWGSCRVLVPELLMDYRGPSTFMILTLKGLTYAETHKMTDRNYSAKYMLHPRDAHYKHHAYLWSSCLSTGWQNSVSLIAREFHYLNTTTRPCVAQQDHFNCVNRYVDERLSAILNCSLPFIEDTTTLQPCDSWRTAKAAFIRTKEFYNNELNFSQCKCQPRCDGTSYIRHGIRMKVDDSLTLLTLEYADNWVDNLNEVYVYRLPSLLSDVGACLSFFLGICLLTVFEILECICEKIRTCRENIS